MSIIERQSSQTVENEEMLKQARNIPPPSVGEIIKGALEDRNISPERFSEITGLSDKETEDVFSENIRMTPDLYDRIKPVFPSLRDYFFHAQKVRDFYDENGVHMPKSKIAQKAVVLYSKLARK
jgi:plasmid maintenance system antidote protein VapI